MPRIGGHRARKLKQQVLVEENYICHLCKKPGADSVDHLIPIEFRPDLEFVRDNLRAVHHNAWPRCNRKRGSKPIPATTTLHTSRVW